MATELTLEQEIHCAERLLSELKDRRAAKQSGAQKEALERIRKATGYPFESPDYDDGARSFSIRCRHDRPLVVVASGEYFSLTMRDLTEEQVSRLLKEVDKMDLEE